MKIYRIQDKDGRGPFKPGFSGHWLKYNKSKEGLVPWYNGKDIDQIKSMFPENGILGAGCRTSKDLRKWFSKKEYIHLRIHGYHAVILGIDESRDILFEDENQILFKRDIPLNMDSIAFKLY